MTVIRPPTRPQARMLPSRDGADPDRADRPAAPTDAGRRARDAAPPGGTPLLRLENVHTLIGGSHLLKGISLTVGRGEIVALLGANGAGKTMTLRTIHGFAHPQHGRIELDGRDITRVPTHELVRMGMGQAPERHRVFRGMSVLDNLLMGAFSRGAAGDVAADLDRVFEQFPRLRERRGQEAMTLSGGEQQMLAIGRALMSRPSILLLDEPSADLAPLLIEQLFETVQEINRQGVTILLSEQKAQLALEIAGRAYVLQTGRVVRSGTARELVDDPEVRAAYLGG